MQSLTPEFHLLELGDINAYLWTGKGGPTLIDSGYPWTFKQLLAEMASADVAPTDLQRIIITHGDIDHSGGLTELQKQSSAAICCHAAEAAYVRGEKRKKRAHNLVGLLTAPVLLFVNWRYKPHIENIEELVIEGKQLPEGFTVIHTPGHSPGHIALYHEEARILVTGDSLTHRNARLGLPPALFTPNMAQAIESLHKYTRLKYDIACFGHGPALMPDASRRIAEFVQSLDAKLAPD